MFKKLSRAWNHLYAKIFGYVWLRCPICGEMFGGHEWKIGNYLITSYTGSGKGVCQNCGAEARRRNQERLFALEKQRCTTGKPWTGVGY